MKIIRENCGVKNYMKEGHRSYRCKFCSCEKEAWKKYRLVRDSKLHRYRRGQGFESRTSLTFFQAFFSQLRKLRL